MALTSDKSNLSPAAFLIALLAALGLANSGTKSTDNKPPSANLQLPCITQAGAVHEHNARALILDS
jgi:hypothetical protein